MAERFPKEHYPPPGSVYLMRDIRAHEVTYAGHSGALITAYVARPASEGRFGGIIIVHGIHGYEEHLRDVARRFAALGYVAIFPNLYSREGFGGVVEEGKDFARARELLANRSDEQMVGDLQGAFRFLGDADYVDAARIGLIGFCSGGHAGLVFACSTKGLSCYANCYSSNLTQTTPRSPIPVLNLIKDLCCPMLSVFGRDDKNPSPEDVEKLRQELLNHHKTFEIVSYKNAGHAFMSDTRESYRPEAANAAWGRIIEWFANYLKP